MRAWSEKMNASKAVPPRRFAKALKVTAKPYSLGPAVLHVVQAGIERAPWRGEHGVYGYVEATATPDAPD